MQMFRLICVDNRIVEDYLTTGKEYIGFDEHPLFPGIVDGDYTLWRHDKTHLEGFYGLQSFDSYRFDIIDEDPRGAKGC